MVKFDAVYPFHGDNTFELIHSIGRLRKYAIGLRDIYIIGDDPGIEGVKVIPYIQEDAKEVNIWKKTLAATFIPELSGRFLFMNDDHFLMDYIDSDLPNYYSGQISDIEGSEQYAAAMDRTVIELEKRGFETFNFDIHCPIFFNKHLFQKVFMRFFNGEEILMKSCYANSLNLSKIAMEDLKFRHFMNKQEVERFTAGRWVFSTWEEVLTHDLKDFITGYTM